MGASVSYTAQDRFAYAVKTQNAVIFGEMCHAYQHALYRAVYLMVGHPQIAEEVVQDTFLKVWRSGPNYDASKGRLYAWMMHIARNTAVDALRSAQYRTLKRKSDSDLPLQLAVAHHADPYVFDMRQHVERLPAKYRDVILCFYFEGYAQEEIGKELGLPLGTVKTRMRHGVKLLRDIYVDDKVKI